MDDLFNLPQEPRLSNSIFKNRPTPHVRTKKKPSNTDEDNHSNVSPAENVESSVVYREKNSYSSNRYQHVPKPSTAFFVTSSSFDENSKSDTSSNPSTRSFNESAKINQSDKDPSFTPMENQLTTEMDDLSESSLKSDQSSIQSNEITTYLEKIRDNPNNRRCADCDDHDPTIAILSWLLVICKRCAAIHRRLTSHFLHLHSFLNNKCDHYLIDLLHDYGNKYLNNFLENDQAKIHKPNAQSSDVEREEYIRQKYLDKVYLQEHEIYTPDELNRMLYENVETSDYLKTVSLLILGANPNYSEKMFAIADHAKRHQQIKQMKIILVNGGLSEFDLIKSNPHDIKETIVYLSTKHGVLKEFLTRHENDRLKIYPLSYQSDKSQRCLFDIDLDHVLAICNQSVNAVSLKCRFTSPPIVNINSQCTLIVDEQTSANEYLWVFPNEIERSIWIREILKRQYNYFQLIYTDFLLLMKLNIQEGITAEKQQVIAIVYSGRFVICSDTIYDEVDLKKYSSLTYQRTEEFTGVILCLASNRFLYFSSPIVKLTEMLYSCLRQAIQVKSLTDLNQQILTSQNIPVIVERFINFIFEHGLQTKGIYRQAGQETKIKQLLNECLEDPFTSTLTREHYSEHDVANGLKRFLRQLEIPLLGTQQNYYAWLRSTVDPMMNHEQLIQYYRALIRDLKKKFPIHYLTLRTMLIHIHSVARLAGLNGMTLSNLIATFTPCLISQMSLIPSNYQSQMQRHRKMSVGDLDFKHVENKEDDEEAEETSEDNSSPTTSKLRRHQTFLTPRHSIASISSLSQFPFSSSYVHVTPSIHADLQIMGNLCRHYRELFDITDEEIKHEETCVETLLTIRNNQYIPRKLDGAMISVYFESRADELNGYAMNVSEQETTADMIIEKLLKQVDKSDCFFWALFEVILDQNLERPMYSCENISEVLYRYRTHLSHELNRQATFVVKLNYVQFERERLQQRAILYNNQTIQCEYFDHINQRWIPCRWIFERAVLKIYRIVNTANERTVKWKANSDQQESLPNGSFDQESLLYSWSVEDLHLYIGADCRFVKPFDMNDYRVFTILPPELPEDKSIESIFGRSFRFHDRHEMFFWYLEIIHVNGYDRWIRTASRAMPDGVNYLPLQNYHTPSAIPPSRKRNDLLRNKFLSKSCHVASNLCRQLRK